MSKRWFRRKAVERLRRDDEPNQPVDWVDWVIVAGAVVFLGYLFLG